MRWPTLIPAAPLILRLIAAERPARSSMQDERIGHCAAPQTVRVVPSNRVRLKPAKRP